MSSIWQKIISFWEVVKNHYEQFVIKHPKMIWLIDIVLVISMGAVLSSIISSLFYSWKVGEWWPILTTLGFIYTFYPITTFAVFIITVTIPRWIKRWRSR